MDERTEPDGERDGVADLIEEAAEEARASARWVRDNLHEALDALGIRRREPAEPGPVRDVNGSDPDDT